MAGPLTSRPASETLGWRRDLRGKVAGAVPIVDVDNGNAGGTGVEHRQQGRYALERGAVSDRRWHGDHRRGDEPGHQPWQCTVHSGDDDDDAGGPELVEPAQDALQPGDTDIDNQVSRRGRGSSRSVGPLGQLPGLTCRRQ